MPSFSSPVGSSTKAFRESALPASGVAEELVLGADADVAEPAAVDLVGEARAVDVTEVTIVGGRVVLVGDHDRELEPVGQTVADARAQPVPVVVPVVGERTGDAAGHRRHEAIPVVVVEAERPLALRQRPAVEQGEQARFTGCRRRRRLLREGRKTTRTKRRSRDRINSSLLHNSSRKERKSTYCRSDLQISPELHEKRSCHLAEDL